MPDQSQSEPAPQRRPRVVQIRVDGRIVAHMFDRPGADRVGWLPIDPPPGLLEMLWDGEVVYSQTQSAVLIDKLQGFYADPVRSRVEGRGGCGA
ncbi:hypothetical protein [Gloeobacter morelensis]|uniref:hypothetical protein n=1 Tax=Gloeobacter morelensis TaxID=2907343 RepID=UPI001E5899F0|nr:hypothetical protein [Gloeobacter morelensis]UFP97148.1 hypothetical protein ISF26_23795 [Gloeobacter morelensis MG652769]